ncbi:unnamed protein product [Amoebophrya sp. A25]|nr:unnamed protein product [Amoebophrya sp. A25]|eukprot:GSA25T00007583001.1
MPNFPGTMSVGASASSSIATANGNADRKDDTAAFAPPARTDGSNARSAVEDTTSSPGSGRENPLKPYPRDRNCPMQEGGTSHSAAGSGGAALGDPRQACDQDEWVDITDSVFRKECADMADGQMLCGTQFNLFDAMSAIVCLEYKMDSGFESAESLNTIEKARRAGLYELLDDKRISDVCKVFDECAKQYLVWASGGRMFQQTLRTCVLLFDVEPLKRSYLFTMLMLEVIHSCLAVRGVVVQAELEDADEIQLKQEESAVLDTRDLLLSAKKAAEDERFAGERDGDKNIAKALADCSDEERKLYSQRLEFIRTYCQLVSLKVHGGVEDRPQPDEVVPPAEAEAEAAAAEAEASTAAGKKKRKRKKPTAAAADGGSKKQVVAGPCLEVMTQRRLEAVRLTSQLLPLIAEFTKQLKIPEDSTDEAPQPQDAVIRKVCQIDFNRRLVRGGPPRVPLETTFAEGWRLWRRHIEGIRCVYTDYHNVLVGGLPVGVVAEEDFRELVVEDEGTIDSPSKKDAEPVCASSSSSSNAPGYPKSQVSTKHQTPYSLSPLGHTLALYARLQNALDASAAKVHAGPFGASPISQSANAQNADLLTRCLACLYAMARTDYWHWGCRDPTFGVEVVDEQASPKSAALTKPPKQGENSSSAGSEANKTSTDTDATVAPQPVGMSVQAQQAAAQKANDDKIQKLSGVVVRPLRSILHNILVTDYGLFADCRRHLNHPHFALSDSAKKILASAQRTEGGDPQKSWTMEVLYDEALRKLEDICIWAIRILHLTGPRRHRQLIHLWNEIGLFVERSVQPLDLAIRVMYVETLRIASPLRCLTRELTYGFVLQQLLVGFSLDIYDDADLLLIMWAVAFVQKRRHEQRMERTHLLAQHGILNGPATGESEAANNCSAAPSTTVVAKKAGGKQSAAAANKNKHKQEIQAAIAVKEKLEKDPLHLYEMAEMQFGKAMCRLLYWMAQKNIIEREPLELCWQRFELRLRMMDATFAFPAIENLFDEYRVMIWSLDHNPHADANAAYPEIKDLFDNAKRFMAEARSAGLPDSFEPLDRVILANSTACLMLQRLDTKRKYRVTFTNPHHTRYPSLKLEQV